MADTPSIPPSSAPATVSSPVTPAAAGAAAQLNLTGAGVRQAPPSLTQPPVPQTIEGQVLSSNPQTQEIRIQTAKGEITVASSANLAPGTRVTLKIYTENLQTRANITIMRSVTAQTQELENLAAQQRAAAPRAVLQEGQKIAAVFIEREKLRSPGASSSPGAPPAPAADGKRPVQVQTRIPPASSPASAAPPAPGDMPDIGDLTPEALQQLIRAYLSTPEGMKESQHLLSPAQNTSLQPRPATDTAEDVLIQILKLRPAPSAPKDPGIPLAAPAPKEPELTPHHLVKTLLTLIQEETAQPQRQQSPAALPPRLEALFHDPAETLPKNVHSLQILKIIPPGTPPDIVQAALQKIPPPAPSLPVMPSIPLQTATVTTFTPQGLPILTTADGDFAVRTPVDIPPGSTVIFTAEPVTDEKAVREVLGLPPRAAAAPGAPRDLIGEGADDLHQPGWPVLEDILQTLQKNDFLAARTLAQSIPQPHAAQMPPAALLFLAMVRAGAIENWLGDNTLRALKGAGKGNLIERLGGDIGRMSAQAKEPLPGEWRSITLPILHDDQVSRLHLHVRRQNDDEGGNGKTPGAAPAARFILNLHLSRMGDLQLDGYIRKKNFDMILRTENRLPIDMRNEIQQRFGAALDQTGMQGGLTFQVKRQGWVTVESAIHAGVIA